VDIPNTFNSIIFATMQQTDPENLFENLGLLEKRDNISPLLIESIQLAANNLQTAPEKTVIFTDDLAPIEWITNTMVLDFILSNEMEYVR